MESISHPECSLSSSWLSWFLFSLFRLCSIWILRLSVSLTRPMLALWRPFFSAKGWNSMGLVGAPLRKQGPAEMGAGLSGPLTLPNLLLHETILLGGLLVKKWPSQTSKLEVMRNLPNISDLGIQTYWPIVDLLFAIGRCPSDMLGWKPNKLCYFNSLKKTHWICGMFLQWHNFEILIFFRHATTNPSFSVGIPKKQKYCTAFARRCPSTVHTGWPSHLSTPFDQSPDPSFCQKPSFSKELQRSSVGPCFGPRLRNLKTQAFLGARFTIHKIPSSRTRFVLCFFWGAHFFYFVSSQFRIKNRLEYIGLCQACQLNMDMHTYKVGEYQLNYELLQETKLKNLQMRVGS